MDIKEDSCFLDFGSESERDTKDLVKKIKVETVTSSSDTKSELEDSTTYSQNEEHHLMRFNETIKESEIETKMDIKEEHWWLEREEWCINDDIKDETHGDFYSAKPLSTYIKDVTSCTSDLSSSEHLGKDICFNVDKNSPLYGSSLKFQSQKNVADMSSMETSVCSETSDDGKLVSMASSKQSKLLQQSNTNKQESGKSVLSHECTKSYKCEVSVKCLKYLSHVEEQRLIVDSKKVNKCDIYDNGLNYLSSSKTRKLIDEGRTHKCKICRKAFTKLSQLKRHTLFHEGIKPHNCNICNKAFATLSHLKTHKLIHDGLKPHKCNICNKAFTRFSSLKRHKLIHEGIKPHKCNICNNAFTRLSHLKAHKLIHEGIKPHTCNICNKAFTDLSNFKTHKLIHQDLKAYKCKICNKTFTQLSSLSRHKRIHKDTIV